MRFFDGFMRALYRHRDDAVARLSADLAAAQQRIAELERDLEAERRVSDVALGSREHGRQQRAAAEQAALASGAKLDSVRRIVTDEGLTVHQIYRKLRAEFGEGESRG